MTEDPRVPFDLREQLIKSEIAKLAIRQEQAVIELLTNLGNVDGHLLDLMSEEELPTQNLGLDLEAVHRVTDVLKKVAAKAAKKRNS